MSQGIAKYITEYFGGNQPVTILIRKVTLYTMPPQSPKCFVITKRPLSEIVEIVNLLGNNFKVIFEFLCDGEHTTIHTLFTKQGGKWLREELDAATNTVVFSEELDV